MRNGTVTAWRIDTRKVITIPGMFRRLFVHLKSLPLKAHLCCSWDKRHDSVEVEVAKLDGPLSNTEEQTRRLQARCPGNTINHHHQPTA